VPVKRGTIAGFKNVGAVGVATNRGALLHPDVTGEELEAVEKVLGVPADVGTACGGTKFVGLCIIANSHAALAGTTTTGPELGRIESSLGFV
jgi:translation initiation factor 6